jgi:phosphoadenosine phosphosulfate reductase
MGVPASGNGAGHGPEHAAALSRDWEELEAREILERCPAEIPGPIALGSAFGREGLVLLHLARDSGLQLPVLFLDTGYHFAETLEFRDAVTREMGLSLVNLLPEESVAEQDARLGPRLYARDPDTCCRLRKVEPLRRALGSFGGWITAIRRDQSPGRAYAPIVEWQPISSEHGVYKVNPLARWTRQEVEAYHVAHALPVHPLWSRGYASIGCAPCTRAIAPGAEERSGRWPGTGKTECGIHTMGLRVPARAPYGAPARSESGATTTGPSTRQAPTGATLTA